MDKVLDRINAELKKRGNVWAAGNAHGWPTETGELTLVSLKKLIFKENLDTTDSRTPAMLRDIADILEKFF